MLLNDFFHINHLSNEENKIIADITINANHAILKGHFPGHPVVPGVCMMEMIKELLEVTFSKKWVLRNSKSTKYLKLFSTVENTAARFELTWKDEADHTLNVSTVLKQDTFLFLKCSGSYIEKK
ncbi:MAG: hypothetical protein IPK62_15220 [Bacteroidetes bacterium]|nr:hypothetical protein [Bacteroidota bacterium]MBP6314512.1 hypothetical protein [Chitinophagaceae bacterium]